MGAPREQIFGAQPATIAGARLIAAPFQFLTREDDNLRIVSVNALTGVTLTIQGRRIDEKGETIPFRYEHTPNTDRTAKTQSFKFGKGALLNLTVQASAGTPVIGETFVMIQLIQGLAGATLVLGTLLQGYVTSTQSLAFPGSPIVSSTEGEPHVRHILATNPPAGQDVDFVVPTGARWEMLQMTGTLSTSAAAGTRTVLAGGSTSGVDTFIIVPDSSQGPSENANYFWGEGVAYPIALVPTFKQQPLPFNMIALAGDDFGIVTLGLNAADQWSNVLLTVREWLEVP